MCLKKKYFFPLEKLLWSSQNDKEEGERDRMLITAKNIKSKYQHLLQYLQLSFMARQYIFKEKKKL
jgi:hypothetical protein